MENLVKLLPVIAVVALVVIIFLLGYVKAPPDVAYIISGIRKRPRVLIGRAGIRIPFLERVDKLIVRQISIDIKSEGYIPDQRLHRRRCGRGCQGQSQDGPGRHPARHEELSEYARSGFQLRHRGFSPGQYARNHRHHLSQGNLQ